MKTLATAALLCLCAMPARAECLDEIKAMMQATLAAGPYHVTMDTSAGGQNHQIEADVILPSSFHMKSDQMEAVMLKEGTWVKTGGTWHAMPAAAAGAIGAKIGDAIKQGTNYDVSKLKNVQCLGPQPIEGKTLSAYSFDNSSELMGMKASSHIMLYKDDQGRPSIMNIDGEVMGRTSKTVQHITYDPSITIIAPK